MRASGILMHISSLPSKYGIGTLGREAYKFVDFLKAAGQRYWQILPIGPTSYGDSPYQSFSIHAGNPYFIDLDILAEEGLLKKSDYSKLEWCGHPNYVDYDKIYDNRYPVLKKAYKAFCEKGDMADFDKFCADNDIWISNYGLFMAIKDTYNGEPWDTWDEGLKMRDPHSLWLFKTAHMDEVNFWMFLQYEFFRQWDKLKKYANDNGILLIGDMPIYVAYDSAAVWVNPDLFELDKNLAPKRVAGCPPDEFSPTGQLWGNPLYDWARHKETGYDWWIMRMRAAAEIYDVVRIDHFRGFDSYYAIPYGDETAERGSWCKGPGMDLFTALEKKLGKLPVIAEDLGFMTDSVKKLLANSGYPGMKVLEFAFYSGQDSDYLPHNIGKNSVVYTGTHDNDTLVGWANSLNKADEKFCREYLHIADDDNFTWEIIRAALSSAADTAIIPMQDYLELDSTARMNTPSTLGFNWKWRVSAGACTKRLAARINKLCKLYFR